MVSNLASMSWRNIYPVVFQLSHVPRWSGCTKKSWSSLPRADEP